LDERICGFYMGWESSCRLDINSGDDKTLPARDSETMSPEIESTLGILKREIDDLELRRMSLLHEASRLCERAEILSDLYRKIEKGGT